MSTGSVELALRSGVEPVLPESTVALRREVRTFLTEARSDGRFEPAVDAWHVGFDPGFSAELGRRGWLGINWPAEHGGQGGSALDRFVVTEELLAAGAPVAAHWVSDRQSGPALLRFGGPRLLELLPAMAAGQLFFALGLSEPDSGSDLASVRTRATPTAGGWRLNGVKIWSSHAQRCHFITVLVRTSGQHGDRHRGLSQLIVPLDTAGVQTRPIRVLDGGHHFNEVVFDDVFVPEDMLLGAEGEGWVQLRAELALERSGPERFMSNHALLEHLAKEVAKYGEPQAEQAFGELVAEFAALRQLSIGVAAAVEGGKSPILLSALVKDLATQFEHRITETVRRVLPAHRRTTGTPFGDLLAAATLFGPGMKFRGGTNEILRGIVAKELGL
jgi:alkylation response protein AidB-like acyl-CoA dehydrogenase